MADRRDSSSGISMRDVSDLLRQLESEYCGDIELYINPARGGSGNVYLFVGARFTPRSVGKRSVRAACTVSSPWPTARAATMAGLYFNLLYDLGNRLDAVKPSEHASEQARFA